MRRTSLPSPTLIRVESTVVPHGYFAWPSTPFSSLEGYEEDPDVVFGSSAARC